MKYIVLYLFLTATRAFSCASCGSGATAPLNLWPHEMSKLYIGLSHHSNFKNVSSEGKVSESLGPREKRALILSYAIRISRKAFASLTLGLGQNTKDQDERMGVLDPTLSLRYELVQQSFVRPLIPQIQFLLSYLNPLGRPIYESREPSQLDVFGSGYQELSAGIDTWFGMWSIKFGASLIYTYTQGEKILDRNMDPGDKWTSVLSSAYLWEDSYKTLIGVISLQQGKKREEGQVIHQSSKRQQDLFITFETLKLEPANLRLTYTNSGAFGPEKNGIKSQSFTFAVMKGFI